MSTVPDYIASAVAQIETLTSEVLSAKREGVTQLTQRGIEIATVNQSLMQLYRLISEIKAGSDGDGVDNIREIVRLVDEVTLSQQFTEQFDENDSATVVDQFLNFNVTDESIATLLDAVVLLQQAIEQFDLDDIVSVLDSCVVELVAK